MAQPDTELGPAAPGLLLRVCTGLPTGLGLVSAAAWGVQQNSWSAPLLYLVYTCRQLHSRASRANYQRFWWFDSHAPPRFHRQTPLDQNTS